MIHVAIDGMLVRKGATGVETSIYGLIRALARYGSLKYSFFLPASSRLPDVQGNTVQTIRCHIPFDSRLLRLLHQHLILPSLLKKQAVDLLHCPGYLAPKRVSVPVVLTIHDLIVYSHPRLCRKSTVLNYRRQMPGAVRRADVIVVPSKFTRDALIRQFPVATGKTRVIPLAVDAIFSPEKETEEKEFLRNKYHLPDSFILFVGQIEPKKNVPGLLEAYSRLRQSDCKRHHLVIAGQQGWESANLNRQAKQLNIAPWVHFPGFIPRSDLPALYRSADVFAFPSFCEGFGLPPLEAMACGTPVVVGRRGALPEVVGPEVPLVDPDDPQALAVALERMLTDLESRKAAVKAGMLQARRFSWQRHVRDMETIYKRLT